MSEKDAAGCTGRFTKRLKQASSTTNATTPNESPSLAGKSPALHVASPNALFKSPALGGLGITMQRPDSTAGASSVAYVPDIGETALHKAAACGHETMTMLLLEGGADTELANSVGRRALHLAAENGHLLVSFLFLLHLTS